VRLRSIVLGALLSALFVFPCLLFAVTRPSLRVVRTWPKAPASLYGGQPVFLSVFESGKDWRGFPLSLRPTYAIYIGRDEGTPSYGHEVPFAFYDAIGDVERTIRDSSVTWSEDGVTFAATSGHRLFVPKDMFLRGR
jgi:hypothetical protein